MKILISAFACNPKIGTEPGNGWSYVVAATERFEQVTVVTDVYNKKDIDEELVRSPVSNLDVHYVSAPLNNKGHYIRMRYVLWQKNFVKYVIENFKQEEYDYVHHVSWATCILPTKLYKLDIPIVVGPVGGGERLPNINLPMSLMDKLTEHIRTLLQSVAKYVPDNRKTWEKARLILVTTEDTLNIIPSKYHYKARVMQTIGVHESNVCLSDKKNKSNDRFSVVVCGRLIYWKGIGIAIEAVKRLIDRGSNVELHIAGVGRLEERLRNTITGYENQIFLHGRIPHAQMNGLYDQADVLLNCSLHDSGCFVILEAMCRKLPVICINTGGPKSTTSEECAFRIEPENYNKLIDKIAETIEYARTHPEECTIKAEKALERIQTKFLYKTKYDQIMRYIEECGD